jgi:hypothetical protein
MSAKFPFKAICYIQACRQHGYHDDLVWSLHALAFACATATARSATALQRSSRAWWHSRMYDDAYESMMTCMSLCGRFDDQGAPFVRHHVHQSISTVCIVSVKQQSTRTWLSRRMPLFSMSSIFLTLYCACRYRSEGQLKCFV